MKRVVCFGAGGHAKVVLDALALIAPTNGIYLVGLIANSLNADPPTDQRVLGDDAVLPAIIAEHRVTHFVIGVGSTRGGNALRPRLFDLAVRAGLEPLTVMHPSAVVARSVSIGAGSVIMAGAVVQPDVNIGRNVIINTRASIDHDCKIGEHVHIAPGAVCSGAVSIGRNTHVGTGATVIEGIAIGSDVTIGAGAVVVEDCADGITVYGVPARRKL